MNIKLEKHYQNAKGVRLAPGIHDLDASLAQYLVANGHAEYVDPPTKDTIGIGDPIPHAVEPYPDSEAIVADLEADTPTLPDANNRKAIKQALDEAGIEYSKFTNTDALYALLTEDD